MEGTVTVHHAAGESEAVDSTQVLPTPALGRAWRGHAREEAAHRALGRPPRPWAPLLIEKNAASHGNGEDLTYMFAHMKIVGRK